MYRILLALAFLTVHTTGARGQEALMLGTNGDLWTMAPNSGQMTYFGDTGVHYAFWSAMAMDSQGRLYAATGRYFVPYAIYELNPQTGAASFIAQTTLLGVSGMAFDANDVLYVANDRTAPQSARPMDLYTVNLTTGIETFIGDTGVNNMLAIDFEPNGILFGYPYADGLVTIDTATGVATDVDPNYRGPNGAVVSMCFDDEGTLYYIDEFLWMLDAETGVASFVDWAAPFGYWAEAVFVEGPAPQFSLWLSGTTGGPVNVKLAGATPGGAVAVVSGQRPGGPTAIGSGFPCAGILLTLDNAMRLEAVVVAGVDGKAVVGPQFVPPAAIGTVRVQAVDLTSCATSNRVIFYS